MTVASEATVLTAALRGLLGGDIHSVERERSPFSTSFPIDHLVVQRDEGPIELVLKDLTWDALLPDAQRTKPRWLYDPRREIGVYRDLLQAAGLGSATFHGAVGTDERTWLFIERVDGVELWQVGDLEVWCDAARWAATLHGRHDLREVADGLPLLRYTPDWYRHWLERAQAVVGEGLAPVVARHDEVVARLEALPATFIHGEYYASNILVDGHGRVCPIDWEMAALGPGLFDLSALLTGWAPTEAAAMTMAYTDVVDAPADEVGVALDCCALQASLQWLGWSAEWRPPPEHARDWLALALDAAERIPR